MHPDKYDISLWVQLNKAVLEASLDATCVVNTRNEIVYMNLAMKSLLGLKARDLKKRLIFCNLLKLSACEGECRILHAMLTGISCRYDEIPATQSSKKLRVTLKAAPIFDTLSLEDTSQGAVVTVRDTSAEVVLQAKYHRTLELLQDKTRECDQLTAEIRQLRQLLEIAQKRAA